MLLEETPHKITTDDQTQNAARSGQNRLLHLRQRQQLHHHHLYDQREAWTGQAETKDQDQAQVNRAGAATAQTKAKEAKMTHLKIVVPSLHHRARYAAALCLVADIDEDLSRGTRHYRNRAGALLMTLDEVVRAILASDLEEQRNGSI